MATDLGAADAHAHDAPVGAGVRDGDGARRSGSSERARWLLPLAVVVLAAALRFAYLPHPDRIYFDETYYATNAAQLLEYGVEAEPRVENDPTQGVDPVFVVHPPVGKWLIAGGIAAFGDNSLGWRFSSAVAGTLLVAVTYFVGLRLFRRRGVAALSAFLLSIDGLALTMSRISMLDVFLALFVAAGAWALLVDRDQRWSRVARPAAGRADGRLRHDPAHRGDDASTGRAGAPDHDDRTPPATAPAAPGADGAAHDDLTQHGDGAAAPRTDTSAGGGHDEEPDGGVASATAYRATAGPGVPLPRMPRPYLWLAGIAFGLAVATKWSGLLAIGAAGLYLLGSELAWRRAVTGSRWREPWRLAAHAGAALVLVPAVVYVGSYGPWFANFERTRPGAEICEPGRCDVGPADLVRGWYGEQLDIFRFHRDLEVTHDYRAAAILWPLTRRPVVYYYEACLDPEPGSSCEVPPGTLEEIVGLGNPAVWWAALAVYPFLGWFAVRRRDAAAAVIAVFLLGQFLPWLGPSRPLFFFYALPLVPFVVLTLGWAAARLFERRGLRWVPVGAAGLALAAFVFWAPLYYGIRITESAWRLRMWFSSWI